MRTRFCGHSSHPDHEAGYGDEGSKGCDGFVIACGDTPKVLNLVDEELDEMTLLVEMPIVRNGARTAGFGGDDGSHVALREHSAKVIGIESLVAEKVLGRQAINQGFGLGRLVHLSGREKQAQDIAEGIDGNVNLGAQTSTRSPDRLLLNPPFPPAACWCARMTVPSMMIDSKSGSSANAARIRSQIPALAQRRKRFHTLFHLPKNGGRSRHGVPVRAIQMTASTNSRLSSPERPGSPGLPGSKCSMRPHCTSDNRCRIIQGFPHSESLESQLGFSGNPLNVHKT